MKQVKATFVAGSGLMLDALARLRRVAPLDTTVLLQGESGTGKELAARFLHEEHPARRGHELVAVHCGAIPSTLLESELFGHVRGAFTGADRDRAGKFELAHGGTLFLDEISTMTPDAQVRLLRVLQERRVTRLGSADSREIDVRVVVATNDDLKALMAQGRFREDLYYRISVFPVVLPPLRERPADIAPLVDHLVRTVSDRLGITALKEVSVEARRVLDGHEWPGNVRELENALEYAIVQSESRTVLERADLPPHIAGLPIAETGAGTGVIVTERGLSFRTAVTHLERELILQSLRLADGNKARAAELLDLKRTTFLEKLRRLEQDGWVEPFLNTARGSVTHDEEPIEAGC